MSPRPRTRTEIVRRRAESGPACIDECQVYVKLRAEFDRVRNDWYRTDTIEVIAITSADKAIHVCEMSFGTRSWSSVLEEVQAKIFAITKNIDPGLRSPTLFPVYYPQWAPPWWQSQGG